MSGQNKICVGQHCNFQCSHSLEITFALKIYQNQNSIFSQKCSLFEGKVTVLVQNLNSILLKIVIVKIKKIPFMWNANRPPYRAVYDSIFFQPNKSCSLCVSCVKHFFTDQHNTLTKNNDVYYNATFNMKRPPTFWFLIHAVVCSSGSWSGCGRCNMHCSDIIRYCGGSVYL